MESTIIRSPNDNCDYKIKVLKNMLNVLMIHDNETELSGASMIVNTGSMMENKTCGIAHFLEHMLFMGNDKYADGGKYFEYINSHGGKTNAFTENIHTCYYFNVANEYFEKSLDMFAHFFVDPLFDKNKIAREINAVNSEYYKNINVEEFKYRRGIKLLSSQFHPFSRFDIGSTSTLRTPYIRNELIFFFNKYYSANNMQLVIISNKSFSEMENIIDVFENIKNNNIEHKMTFGNPFVENKIIKIIPVSTNHKIIIYWAIPFNKKYFDEQIINYIFYLIGRETNNSLTHHLISNSLINDLNINISDNLGDYVIVSMVIDLTEYGLRNIDIILQIINSYITSIKNNKLDIESYQLFLKCLDIKFKFAENQLILDKMMRIMTNICSGHATINESPYYDYYHDKKYDVEILKKYYSECIEMFDISHSNIVIGSQFFSPETKKHDELFNFDYVIENNNYFDRKIDVTFELIPTINANYIPAKLIIYKNKQSFKIPKKIEGSHDVWFNYIKTDIPKVCVAIEISNNDIYKSCHTFVVTQILINSIRKKLFYEFYDSTLCDTNIDMSLVVDKVYVIISGFNDKIVNIIDTIFNTIKNPNIDLQLFTYAKNLYLNTLNKKIVNPPFVKLQEMLNDTFYEKSYPIEEKIKCISIVEFSDINNINLLENCEIKCLINGNITKLMSEHINLIINGYCHIHENTLNNWTLRIPKTNESKFYNSNDYDSNSLCAMIFMSPIVDVDSELFYDYMSITTVMNNLLSDKFFVELRSKKQLGYIVRSYVGQMGIKNKMIFQNFFIQSQKLNPDELEIQMRMFIKNNKEIIMNMTQQELNKYLSTCAINININPINIIDMTTRLFTPIKNETYIFDIETKLSEKIRSIKIFQIKQFYENIMLNNNSIHVIKYYNSK